MVYARWGYEYLQQRPDGRILVGGFSDVDADDSYTDSDAGSPLIWDRVERYLREDLGVDPELTHHWAGVVGYTEDSLPYVGEVPGRDGLYVSGGYSGVGNVPGFMCGRDIADTIAGQAREPLFPAGRGRWADPAPPHERRPARAGAREFRLTYACVARALRARMSVLAGGVASSFHRRSPGRSTSSAVRARASGTWTATSTSTSTTGSAR